MQQGENGHTLYFTRLISMEGNKIVKFCFNRNTTLGKTLIEPQSERRKRISNISLWAFDITSNYVTKLDSFLSYEAVISKTHFDQIVGILSVQKTINQKIHNLFTFLHNQHRQSYLILVKASAEFSQKLDNNIFLILNYFLLRPSILFK